jgi:hypothetical protein
MLTMTDLLIILSNSAFAGALMYDIGYPKSVTPSRIHRDPARLDLRLIGDEITAISRIDLSTAASAPGPTPDQHTLPHAA